MPTRSLFSKIRKSLASAARKLYFEVGMRKILCGGNIQLEISSYLCAHDFYEPCIQTLGLTGFDSG